MPVVCAACGAPNQEGARFCSQCASPLAAGVAPTPIEERRWVTILFADLAGFTERSDRADPEDVRRLLLPFHTVAKAAIERFGGTLDKFIGDAVMGVFGAPVAHEDDAERAVRAALDIQRAIGEIDPGLGIRVRVAVNSGEAVVTFATGPQIGENVAGDVVNTASRLQSVAPVGGVVVGEATYRVTRETVDYRELAPVSVKGKAEPLRVWVAVAVGSIGDRPEAEEATPFVGREEERTVIRDRLERARADRSVHLVTIVGEPGIGKSRLVADLRKDLPEGVAWLRGRCLPYGEGISFWAVAEMIKGATGILESDGREVAERKLADVIGNVESRPEQREWLRARLAPLLGTADAGAEGTVARQELFTAWLRFLEGTAAARPSVLVFEDLHWADPALLEFVELAAARLTTVPVLILATARPLFDERRPGWGRGPNATTIVLEPLSAGQMEQLVAALLKGADLPSRARDALTRTAGGNPLYARECVRMLADRERDAEGGPSGEPGGAGAPEVAVPDSVQALIAARLDALSGDHRARLQDASVVGEVFWPGALESIRPDALPGGLAASLHELDRRGLIEPVIPSSVEGERELRFTHNLIREVTYRQIPRGARGRRHVAVARWIERLAADRAADRSELVAHHYLEGLELARSAGAEAVGEDLPALEEDARRASLLAGDHAAALDTARSAEFYERALAVTPPGHPARPTAKTRWAMQAWRADQLALQDTQAALREAADAALAAGDRLGAAAALERLQYLYGFAGQGARTRELLSEAMALLEGEPPGPLLARMYVSRADEEMFAGRTEASREWAERAIDLSRSVGADLFGVMALHIRGNARLELGDAGGMDDLQAALQGSLDLGSGVQTATSYEYLGEWLWIRVSPARGLEMIESSIEIAESRGLVGMAMWSRAGSFWMRFDLGQWDHILDESVALLDWEARQGTSQVGVVALPYRARVLVHRGAVIEAAELVPEMLSRAEEAEDLQLLAPVLAVAAVVASAAGDRTVAMDRVAWFDRATETHPAEYREAYLADVVRVCAEAGDLETADRLLAGARTEARRHSNQVLSARAALAEARREWEGAAALHAEAAEAWHEYGHVHEAALSRAGLALCLRALGRDAEAHEPAAAAASALHDLGIP